MVKNDYLKSLKEDKEPLVHNCFRILNGNTHARNINNIRKFGFKPIGFTVMMCENTFIFETEDEALRAYNKFETGKNKTKGRRPLCIQGYWYSRRDFEAEYSEYKSQFPDCRDVVWFEKKIS